MQRTFAHRAVCLILLIVACGFHSSIQAQKTTYNLADALTECHDFNVLLAPPDPPRRHERLTSVDPNGANFDQGNFLREERFEQVLMDVEGPGVLTRLWTSEPMGMLRFYWDGSDSPQLAVLWSDLAAGKVLPLDEPFVTTAAGGSTMQFPLPFRDGLKITLSGQQWCAWSIDYDFFSRDVQVESWWPEMGPPPGVPQIYTRAAILWEDPAKFETPGEAYTSESRSIHSDSEPIIYTSDEDQIVTEVGFYSTRNEIIPPEILLEIEQEEGDVAIPWRTITGAWDSETDFATLHTGRIYNYTYFRIPFLLQKNKNISLRWKGDADGELIGKLVVNVLPAGDVLASAPRLAVSGFYDDTLAQAMESNGRAIAFSMSGTTRMDFRGKQPVEEMFESDRILDLQENNRNRLVYTRIEDLFGCGIYMPSGKYHQANSAVNTLSQVRDKIAGTAEFGWTGIPFNKSAFLSSPEFKPDTYTDFSSALICQVFPGDTATFGPDSRLPAPSRNMIGKRVTTSKASSPMVYTEFPTAGRENSATAKPRKKFSTSVGPPLNIPTQVRKSLSIHGRQPRLNGDREAPTSSN